MDLVVVHIVLDTRSLSIWTSPVEGLTGVVLNFISNLCSWSHVLLLVIVVAALSLVLNSWHCLSAVCSIRVHGLSWWVIVWLSDWLWRWKLGVVDVSIAPWSWWLSIGLCVYLLSWHLVIDSWIIDALLVNLGCVDSWCLWLSSHLLTDVLCIGWVYNWNISLVRLLLDVLNILNVLYLLILLLLQGVLSWQRLGLYVLVLLWWHVNWGSLHVCVLWSWKISLLGWSSRTGSTWAISSNAWSFLAKGCNMVIFESFCLVAVIATNTLPLLAIALPFLGTSPRGLS